MAKGGKKQDGFGPEEESLVKKMKGIPSYLLKRETHRPGLNYSQKIGIHYSRTPKR